MSVFKLEEMIRDGEALNDIFHTNDPESISWTLQTELSSIINYLAPPVTRQATRDWTPYMTASLRKRKKELDAQLSLAIGGGSSEDWRHFHLQRSQLNFDIEQAKENYYAAKIDSTSTRWSTFKNLGS